MRFAALLALGLAPGLVAGCRVSLDHQAAPDASDTGRACKVSTNIQVCLDAEQHSDFQWIQDNVFAGKCTFSACHDGNNPKSALDLSSLDRSYATLVNQPSDVDKSRVLVVPGQSAQSYLLVMMGAIDPADADPPSAPVPSNPGLMPQSSSVLCCQKLDALDRWIAAGAPNQ